MANLKELKLSGEMKIWNAGNAAREGEEGALNPEWVEWQMGFPAGWTDIGTQSR